MKFGAKCNVFNLCRRKRKLDPSSPPSPNIVPIASILKKTPPRTPADGQEAEELTLVPSKLSAPSTPSSTSASVSTVSGSSGNHTTVIPRDGVSVQNNSSSVYVNSPAAQVQKRVVTHVTIFPSPPPDLIQTTQAASMVSASR